MDRVLNIMKQRNIKLIEMSTYHFKKTNLKMVDGCINGYDTETDINGDILTISDAYRKPVIINENERLDQILNYMTSRTYSNNNNFFWNLDFDVSAICKNLPKSHQIELYDKGYTTIPFKGDFLKIEYFKRKMFKLSKFKDEKCEDKIRNNIFIYWDIMPYYMNMSLKNAAPFVNENKFEVNEINELNYIKFHNDLEYQKMILTRVKTDCITTMKLAKLMIKVLNNIAPYDKFFSLAGNSGNLALHNLPDDKLSNKGYLTRPSEKLNQLALMSYGGGIFTPLKKGHFEKVYAYDINSAYTDATVRLKSFEGEQIFSPNSMKKYDENFNHLFIKCNLDIPDGITYSPFQFRTKSQLYYISGKFKNIWITKEEYDYFTKKGYISKSLGFIGIDDRYNESFYMFKGIQETLYKNKSDIKARMTEGDYKDDSEKQYDKVLYQVVKTLLNSMYGKTINVNEYKRYLDAEDIEILDLTKYSFEKNKASGKIDYYEKLYKAGNLFSAPLGSEITAHTRVLIHEAIGDQQDSIINIATDGIKATSKLKGLNIGTKLGQWEDESKGHSLMGISLASGQYCFYNQKHLDDPKDNKAILKMGSRGLAKGFNFIPYLEENKDVLGFEIKKNSPLKTFQCVKGLKYDQKDIGVFTEHTKEFSLIEGDRYSRNWDRSFKDNRDILENSISSKVLTLNQLLKIPNLRIDDFNVGIKK